jgi:hypothetical protein
MYQWKKNGSDIQGARSNFYQASASGIYQVKIISGSSVAWSANVSITADSCQQNDTLLTGIDTLSALPENDIFKINVYPNPTTGLFNFELRFDGIQEKEARIEVLSPLGQTVYSKYEDNISGYLKEAIELDNNLATGIYVLRLTIGRKTENIRVVLLR